MHLAKFCLALTLTLFSNLAKSCDPTSLTYILKWLCCQTGSQPQSLQDKQEEQTQLVIQVVTEQPTDLLSPPLAEMREKKEAPKSTSTFHQIDRDNMSPLTREFINTLEQINESDENNASDSSDEEDEWEKL